MIEKNETEFSDLEVDFLFLVDAERNIPNIDLQELNMELPELSNNFPGVEFSNMDIDLMALRVVLNFDIEIVF
ncbi:hypothetical protein [Chryseobacterium phocaeense]|uniref:hypothetical protein n=1 Tax=Chryseobacterium phocaeense TaxID=1816690 RepID=UPI0009B95AD1|nr:hypothetical protein [Chryseobacterium phocaeense]